MVNKFLVFLYIFCSTMAIAPSAHADPGCIPYLLGPGGGRVQSKIVQLPNDQIFALLKSSADAASVRRARIQALESGMPALDQARNRTKDEAGWLSRWSLGTLSNTEQFKAYQNAIVALGDARRELNSLKKNEKSPSERELTELLVATAKEVLLQSLLEPRPQWLKFLKVLEVSPVGNTQDLVTDSNTLQVGVFLQGSPRKDFRKGRTVTIPVYLVLNRAGASRAGVTVDRAAIEQNIHSYDDFRLGTVLDPVTYRRVAHSSVDQRIVQLHLSRITQGIRAALATQMSESPLLRRNVHQVLTAAVNIRKLRQDNNVPEHTRTLLRAYFEYWATAYELSADNMLRSAFLIGALTKGPFDQMDLATAIREQTRISSRGRTPFNRNAVRVRLEQLQRARASTSVASSTSSGDDGFLFFYPYYWDNSYGTYGKDPNYIGKELPAYQELTDAVGNQPFDTPSFVSYEATSNPDNSALDASVSGWTDALGASTDASGDSGGGGGGGDGGSDGDGDGG